MNTTAAFADLLVVRRSQFMFLKAVVGVLREVALERRRTTSEGSMTPERLETRAQLSWRFALWVAIAGCLLLPLLAMQVTDQVAWTGFDFIAAAVLLIGAGVAFELVARLPLSQMLRAIVGLAIAAAVALLWAHGAVGVF